jgi:TPR repeat protein
MNLASMSEAGRGVTRSDALAVSLLEKACAARQKAACWNLAERYRAGRGVKKDDAKAAALAKQACDLGHGEACGAGE